MTDEGQPRERRRKRSDLEKRPPIEAEPLPAPDSPELEVREDRRLAFYRESFVGPVPPPSIIEAYEEVHPGAASAIFGSWQEQSRHRRDLESKVIDADIAAEWRGLHLGFVLALVVVIGGFVLVGLDKDVYGIVAILGTLVSLSGVFVYSKKRQATEIAEKSPPQPVSPNDEDAPTEDEE